MVVVTNGSNRPIRAVAVRIVVVSADRAVRHEKLADVYGELMGYDLGVGARGETFVFQSRDSTMPLLRAGHTAGFVGSFTASQFPGIVPTVRFTDDAGMDWEIGADLHLQKLGKRDW
jgi:hypothetical protein